MSNLILFGQFKEEDKKAGSFITTEGRVVFVGGPGSGGGTSGGGVGEVAIVGNQEAIQRTQDEQHPLNPIYENVTGLSMVAVISDNEAQVQIGKERRNTGIYTIKVMDDNVYVGGNRPESKSTLSKYVPTVNDAIAEINKHYPITKAPKYKQPQPNRLQPDKVGPGSRPRLINR